MSAREDRVRRMAAKHGLKLMKSRLRTPSAYGYGTYMLIDPMAKVVVASGSQNGFGLSLDDVEDYLSRPE